jgi:hypothetical protein
MLDRAAALTPAMVRQVIESGLARASGSDLHLVVYDHAGDAKVKATKKTASNNAKARWSKHAGASVPHSSPHCEPDAGAMHVTGRDETRRNETRRDATSDSSAKPERVTKRLAVLPSDALEVAEHLATRIREHTPDAKTNAQGWARDIDLAMRQDGRTADQLKAAIDWAHCTPEGSFWQGNVLSGKKLRDQFDTMRIQARSRAGPKGGGLSVEQLLAGEG